MSKIKIIRRNKGTDFFRSYKLFLGDKKLGEIKRNATEEFDIPEGIHTIIAKIDWVRSQKIEFAIRKEETKVFEVSSFPHAGWIMPISFAFVTIDIIFEILYPGFRLFFYLIIPGFLMMMYYLTFGKSRYLILKEI